MERDGLELAVFRMCEKGDVRVTDNTCPHAGGNLSGGEVNGGVVTCPWHQWEFDLRSGQCPHSNKARVRSFPALVRNGEVWADLSAPPRRGDLQEPQA